MFDKRCDNCMYFDTSTTADNGERAACRVRPPVADAKTEYGIWPHVHFEDWCGAFTPARPAPEQPKNSDDDMPF